MNSVWLYSVSALLVIPTTAWGQTSCAPQDLPASSHVIASGLLEEVPGPAYQIAHRVGKNKEPTQIVRVQFAPNSTETLSLAKIKGQHAEIVISTITDGRSWSPRGDKSAAIGVVGKFEDADYDGNATHAISRDGMILFTIEEGALFVKGGDCLLKFVGGFLNKWGNLVVRVNTPSPS